MRLSCNFCLRAAVVVTCLSRCCSSAFTSTHSHHPAGSFQAAKQTKSKISWNRVTSKKTGRMLPKPSYPGLVQVEMSQGPQEDIETESDPSNVAADEGKRHVSYKFIIAMSFAAPLILFSVAAIFGLLKGPFDSATGSFGTYAYDMILRDVFLTFLTSLLAYALVKFLTWTYLKGYLDAKVVRKLIHTLSAPLFMVFWPLFSPADGARYFASVVTFVNIIRLYLAGSADDFEAGSKSESVSLANAVSRTGRVDEALGGPFVYVCVMHAVVWLNWRSNVVGVVALSTLAVGDGSADLIGRRWGQTNKWFFSKDKSMVGSLAFTVTSWLSSLGLIWWLSHTDCLQLSLGWSGLAYRLFLISGASALVELLPVGDDNYTVPLAAAVLTYLLIQ